MVECQLPKLNVEGSTPFRRSIFPLSFRRKSEAMPKFFRIRSNLFLAFPLLWVSCLLLTGCPSAPPPTHVPGVVVPPTTAPRTPRIAGGYYTIRKGDTLYSIARQNGIEWYDILEANSWLDPLDLPVGQSILIPGVPDPAAPGDPASAHGGSHAFNPGHDGPVPAERRYVWPVKGRVAAHYGQSVPWRMWTANHGIDIRADAGEAVVAAKSGRVNTFSEVPGFGRVVVLEHTDGTTTFYGHLNRILVKHGRWARQGEKIGVAGSSGATSGTALHFRILRNGATVNPLLYLPN